MCDIAQKCYSTNNEDYIYDDIESAIESSIDDLSIQVGSEFLVYEGDAIKYKAGDFSNGLLNYIVESAYGCGEEYSDGYLDEVTKEQEAELDNRIADAVNQWADEHGFQPKFGRVDNIKEIRVRVISESLS